MSTQRLVKQISSADAAALVRDGARVMIGGFLNCGSPEKLIDEVLAAGKQSLTVIANDTAFPDKGIGKMIVARRVQKAIVSHIGTNPETGRQMNAGELVVELVPQGSLAEKIRAGGFGLGGFYTPTGVGTIVADGKETKVIDGKTYLLELPLTADVALVKAYKSDKAGNLVYRRSAQNFNPLMATAAATVIVEAEHIVEVGEIDPDEVMTPSIFVQYLVQG